MNLSFDVNSILTGDEVDKLFTESDGGNEEVKETEPETADDNSAEEEKETPETPEKVGKEDKKDEIQETAVEPQSDGTSPDKFYSSIASALKNDGIFPDLEENEIEGIKTPEDFAELFEKAVNARLDEKQRRIDEALKDGVAPDSVKMYEQTLQYLDSIDDDAIASEEDEGEALRRQLIYNDLINRGYTKDEANNRMERSFKSGSDVDDAKDALIALKKFYKTGYDNVRAEAKKQVVEAEKNERERADKFKRMVLDDELKFGDTVLDQRTKQKVFDAVSKPVYKDKETGQMLTQIQKMQKENPLEFLKQLGMWFVLTDGGKNPTGLVKQQVLSEKNKGIRELERKINGTMLNADGSLKYASGTAGGSEKLLEDGWQIGWKPEE